MKFFGTLIAVPCVPRVALCRRSEPIRAAQIRGPASRLPGDPGWRQPYARLRVGQRPHRRQPGKWNTATWVQIGLLAVLTLTSVGMILELRRLGLPGHPAGTDDTGTDWLADSVLCARKQSRLPGPARRPADAWTVQSASSPGPSAVIRCGLRPARAPSSGSASASGRASARATTPPSPPSPCSCSPPACSACWSPQEATSA
jgi:hypothetical protein